ncbi:MAG: CARDB domain-containing protein [Albidovulum sp.]
MSGLDGNDTLDGGTGNDSLLGGAGDDLLLGGAGDDTLASGPGNDTVDGGTGSDVAILEGNRDSYTVQQIDAVTVQVTGAGGTVLFTNVESFTFDDVTMSFDELVYIPVPNLAAGGLSLSDTSLAPGESGIVSFDVISDGETDSSAGAVLEIVTSAGVPVTTVRLADIAALGAGQSTSLSFDLASLDLPPGDYSVRAVIDPSDVLNELDETDNTSAWQSFTVETPVHDVAMTSVGINAAASDFDNNGGATLVFDIALSNNGNVDSGSQNVQLYITVATAGGGTEQVLIDTVPVSLAPGGTLTLSHTVALDPSIPAGSWQVTAVLDPASGQPDDNTGNNSATAMVTLVGGTTYGTGGDDLMAGSAVDDIILAGAGNDTILASGGSDTVDGGAGHDTLDLSGLDHGVAISGGVGQSGTIAPDWDLDVTIMNFSGIETVIGTDFDDDAIFFNSDAFVFHAGAGNDNVYGSDHGDTLNGGDGDDVLIGLGGDDVISLGEGNDIYYLAYFYASEGLAQGADVVSDFNAAEDQLYFGYDASSGPVNPLALATQTAEGVLFDYGTGSSVLLLDVDLADLNAMNVIAYDIELVGVGV